MDIYDKYILPKVIHYVCGNNPTMKQRGKIVPLAEGRVLEVGVGSGHNLSFYDRSKVRHLTAIDPSEELWQMRKVDTESLGFDVAFMKAGAEALPLDSNSIDSAVITYTLCSIRNSQAVLEEIRRVLKPGGSLLFCEHGKAPDKAVRLWQDRINPVWGRFGGGCSLNKDIPLVLKEGGFKISRLESMYIPGWKVISFNYWGTARCD